jgi:hypothetical protein
VDLLSQAFPGRTRLGILWDAGSADQFEAAEAAARSLRMDVHGYKFERLPYDLDAAFLTVTESSIQALLVDSSPLFAPYGQRIAELAIEYRLPTMFIVRSGRPYVLRPRPCCGSSTYADVCGQDFERC